MKSIFAFFLCLLIASPVLAWDNTGWNGLDEIHKIHWLALGEAPATAVATGNNKVCAPIPWEGQWELISLDQVAKPEAWTVTASDSGAITIQVRNSTDSVDLFSTAPTIDQDERTTRTAATASVINASNALLDAGDILCLDCDGAGSNAYGLGIALPFRKR